jgi:hypothetical protein
LRRSKEIASKLKLTRMLIFAPWIREYKFHLFGDLKKKTYFETLGSIVNNFRKIKRKFGKI